METKRVSAFELYRSLSSAVPVALNAQDVGAKKKKVKVQNGPSPLTSKKTKRKRVEKRHGKHAKKELVENARDMQEDETSSLDSFLTSLSKVNSSRQRASALFHWLINPVSSENFFRDTWEKKPLLVRRQKPDYYHGLFSTTEFDRILRTDNVQFGVNLDVTSYSNGKRKTHNPPGRALSCSVWKYYESGCSLRLLNPQAFSSTVWNVLSILQEMFGSMVGANIYLTPAGTQGFAPHYDDIEAFVVQLEGKKHWRVYSPRSDEETLSLVSSPNFSQSVIGKPIMEVVLEAGDLLYFPRGFIHQGDCLPDAHSLHITISSYQRNSWGDLLMKMVPAALEMAMEEDVEFRKGLPLDYLSYMGVQNSEKNDPRRVEFQKRVDSLMKKLAAYAPVDAAVDQKAREFLHDCLPPVLTPDEKTTSVFGAPARWEDGEVVDVEAQIRAQTRIRFIRGGIARLCSNGEDVLLCHTIENSRVYHKEEPKSLEIKSEVSGVSFFFFF
uniref:Bifunctional lysine-specific demethylase and histidyl-hydroxylase n=1 Tax=Denticeps clupeoides TaxID=299321 RepID=A0AAY4DKM5_9TELE